MGSTLASYSGSHIDRNRILLGIQPTIKKMARKYMWAFDTIEDAMSEITLRMIKAIDRGSGREVDNELSWYSYICKLEAKNSTSRRKDIPVPIDEIPDVGYFHDPTDSMAVKKALSIMKPKKAEALVKFHVHGMAASDIGVTKEFIHDSRAEFRNAMGGIKPRSAPNRSDINSYTFKHSEHGEFTGTRGEFCAKYGISVAGVHKLVSGIQKTHKGWSLT